jgi:hypothetical protein
MDKNAALDCLLKLDFHVRNGGFFEWATTGPMYEHIDIISGCCERGRELKIETFSVLGRIIDKLKSIGNKEDYKEIIFDYHDCDDCYDGTNPETGETCQTCKGKGFVEVEKECFSVGDFLLQFKHEYDLSYWCLKNPQQDFERLVESL